MRRHLGLIFVVLVAACSGVWAAPLGGPAPRANCPEENFRFNNQLVPLKAEMDQGTWKEAADRLGQLLTEAGDELMGVEGGTISFATWVRNQPFFTNPSLADAYNTLYDERAQQMLDVARLAAAHRPADLAVIARRYPLTATARVALAAAADRAMDLGDAVAALVLYDKAAAAGWKADDLHSKRMTALAALRQPKRVGRLPLESKWYMDKAKWNEAKALPLLAANSVFVETSTGLSAMADGGNSLWTWTAPKPVEGTTAPAPTGPELILRGNAGMPGVLLGLDGSPQIVVSRQPQSLSAELCLRAFRARDGRPLWTTDGDETFATMLFIGQPLVSGGSVYCVVADDGAQGVQLALISLDVMTGSLQWQRPLAAIVDCPVPRNRVDPKAPVPPPVVVRPGTPPRPGPREAEDIWTQGQPAVDEECVYVSPNIGCVFAVGRLDGKIHWTRRYPSIALPDERFAVKPLGPMDVNAIKQWENRSRLAVKTRFSNTPAVAGKTVVVAPFDFGGVLGLDKTNGNLLWETRDLDAGTLIGATDKVAVLASGAVSAIDVETGRDKWRQDAIKTQKLTGPPAMIGGVVYGPTAAGMVTWNAEDGRPAAGAPKLPDGARVRIGP